MPMGVGQIKYLVLEREDLTNQLEGRGVRNKMMTSMYKFLLEYIIIQYNCVGKIVVDRGELNANDAMELLNK